MAKLSRDDCALLAGGWQGWVSVLGITPGVLPGTSPASASTLGVEDGAVGWEQPQPCPNPHVWHWSLVQCSQGAATTGLPAVGAWSRSAWGRTLVVLGHHSGRRSCKS